MAKIVYITFAVLLVATIALAADNEKEGICKPWLSSCQISDECCRHLVCATYQSKCIPTGGLVIPGKDKRPIGPGPFPPGYIP